MILREFSISRLLIFYWMIKYSRAQGKRQAASGKGQAAEAGTVLSFKLKKQKKVKRKKFYVLSICDWARNNSGNAWIRCVITSAGGVRSWHLTSFSFATSTFIHSYKEDGKMRRWEVKMLKKHWRLISTSSIPPPNCAIDAIYGSRIKGNYRRLARG